MFCFVCILSRFFYFLVYMCYLCIALFFCLFLVCYNANKIFLVFWFFYYYVVVLRQLFYLFTACQNTASGFYIMFNN